jgi:hypothetical protein
MRPKSGAGARPQGDRIQRWDRNGDRGHLRDRSDACRPFGGAMRTTWLLASLPLLAACNGSSPGTAPTNDAGNPESGADGGIPDGGFGDTGATEGGGEATTQDGCTAFAFDASAYAFDGGDAAGVIGTPCLPSQESSSTVDGFSSGEVTLTSTQSGAPACLVYHFRGLVTCPYGQSATGKAPTCASPCTTISGQPVVGPVAPQCADRPASKVVLWSCRCANAQGRTDDGDAYCTCPSSSACTQVIASIGASEDNFSGAYCLPPGVVSDGGTTCSVSCDPTTVPCR